MSVSLKSDTHVHESGTEMHIVTRHVLRLAIMHTGTVSAHLLVVGRLGSRVHNGATASANSLRL